MSQTSFPSPSTTTFSPSLFFSFPFLLASYLPSLSLLPTHFLSLLVLFFPAYFGPEGGPQDIASLTPPLALW